MQEIWKDIKGYEGLYQVSNLGRVKSLLFHNNVVTKKREKILAQRISNSGYLMVGLNKNSKGKKLYVHRLVAEAFVENPLCKKEVNHKDGNKLNNNANNLEFCTPSENIKHSYEKKLHIPLRNENNRQSRPVIQYDLNMNLLEVFPSIAEAKRKTNISCIRPCCGEKINTCGGYIWEYAKSSG
jgi:hypothetical protein